MIRNLNPETWAESDLWRQCLPESNGTANGFWAPTIVQFELSRRAAGRRAMKNRRKGPMLARAHNS